MQSSSTWHLLPTSKLKTGQILYICESTICSRTLSHSLHAFTKRATHRDVFIFQISSVLLLRLGSAAARLLRLRVWIPPGHGCLSVVIVVCLSLRQADHSSIVVLPTVLCHCVWSRNLKNEKAKTRKWVVKASKRRIRRCFTARNQPVNEQWYY
jgi:hypothetical protein